MTYEDPVKVKVFLPEARVLSEKETAQLTSSRNRDGGGTEDRGLWVEIECPDHSCIGEDGRITLPPKTTQDRGVFLKLFCPEGNCKVVESTDLP